LQQAGGERGAMKQPYQCFTLYNCLQLVNLMQLCHTCADAIYSTVDNSNKYFAFCFYCNLNYSEKALNLTHTKIVGDVDIAQDDGNG
jgi:hypothetical protein